MVLKQLQRFKDRHGIGFSGSRNKKKREDSERKVNTSRPRKNRRGRTTGKEYWNPMTGKYQSSPVKAPVTKDHLGRDPGVGAANRKKVRQNPVSDETLKTVRKTLEKEKTQTTKAKVSDYMDKPKTDPYSTTALANKAAKTKVKSKNKVQRDVKGREVEAVFKDGKYTWQPKSQEKLKINGNKDSKKPESTPTTVFTKHYKTGKDLGVMSRSARRAYEKEAGTRTWESEKKRLGAKGNKQNPKASSKSWRKKQELKLAKKDTNSIKASKNQSEEEKKRQAGFNAERPGSSI